MAGGGTVILCPKHTMFFKNYKLSKKMYSGVTSGNVFWSDSTRSGCSELMDSQRMLVTTYVFEVILPQGKGELLKHLSVYCYWIVLSFKLLFRDFLFVFFPVF